MNRNRWRAWIAVMSSGVILAAPGATCHQKDLAEVLGTTNTSQDAVADAGTRADAVSTTGVTPGLFIGPRR